MFKKLLNEKVYTNGEQLIAIKALNNRNNPISKIKQSLIKIRTID